MEARVEEQLAEFDTEREQLRSRLKKEEAHCCQLQQQVWTLEHIHRAGGSRLHILHTMTNWSYFSPLCDQVEELKRKLEETNMTRDVRRGAAFPVEAQEKEWATKVLPGKTAVDAIKVEDIEEDRNQQPVQPKVNGHCLMEMETNGHNGADNVHAEKICLQNGSENSPSTLPPSSPCASPVLAKRPPGSPSPGSYHSPYQAGINQRFHAARHKFQGTIEPEPQAQIAAPPLSPKEVSPPSSSIEASPVKQMARSTVTQVLSRFTTVQQGAAAKLAAPNNSPFGTDYRSLAAPLSPIIGRAAGGLPQGIRSPTIPRADRGNPPPIPPKKPGLAQAPPSPATVPRSASHFSDNALSGTCGLTSSQEGVKELDMVVSSN